MKKPLFSGGLSPERAWRAASAALLAFGLLCSAPAFFMAVENPDLYWHLSAARWILAHGRLPTEDFLSWTLGGQPWTDFEWLTQVVYYSLFKAGGFRLLVLFKASLFGGTLFFFAKLLRLYGLGGVLFLALPALTAGLLPSLDVRPDNFTYFFFTAELYFLEKFRLKGFPERKGALLAGAAGFFALWANLHAGFAYGLFMLGLYLAGELVAAALPLVYGTGPARPLAAARGFLAVLCAGAAGTLLNVHGWHVYTVILQHMQFMGEMTERILEWAPSSIYNEGQALYWATTAGVFAAMLRRQLRSRDLPFAQLFAVLYFSLSSSSHVRHGPFLVLTGLPAFFHDLQDEDWRGFRLWAARALAAAAFVLVCSHMYSSYTWSHLKGDWRGDGQPAGAANFLEQNSAQLSGLRLLNPWGWGGYLGWRLSPAYKISFDGRYIFHPLLGDVVNAFSGKEDWDRTEKKYGWELVLTEAPPDYYLVARPKSKTGKKLTRLPPLYTRVLPREKWAMVYWDAQAIIFVRRDKADRRWLQANEYTVVRSGDLPFAAARLAAGEVSRDVVRREVIRYLKGPDLQGSYGMRVEVGDWYRRLGGTSHKTHI